MSLTVTLPASYEAARLRREIMTAIPALEGELLYTVVGDQLTIEHLEESDRAVVEQAIVDHVARENERLAVLEAYASNLAFLALATPNTTQAVAQIKALTRQINFLARALL